MVRILLSLLIAIMPAAVCRAASDGVADEFKKLSIVDSKALIHRAYAYIEKCQYDSALIYYSAVANRYDDNADRKEADNTVNALYNIAIIYMVGYYDYAKSYDYLLQSQELAERYQLEEHLPNIYNSIASILQASAISDGDVDKKEIAALLRKGFYGALHVKDYEGAAISLSNLLQIGYSSAHPAALDREIGVYRSTRMPDNLQRKNTLTQCRAYRLFCKRKYTEALALLRQTLGPVADSPIAYRDNLSTYNRIVDIYTAMHDMPAIIRTTEEAIAFARKYHADDYITEFYGTLFNAYTQMGDSAMAQHYEYLYLKNGERVFARGKLSSVKGVAFQHELTKANEQVKSLTQHRRLQNILLVSALSVLCVIGILLFRLYRAYAKIRQTNRYLYDKNLELLASEKKARAERIAAEAATTASDTGTETNTSATASPAAQESPDTAKYKGSRLSDEDTHDLFLRIRHAMETSDAIYQTGFNIDKLSDLVHSRPRYVSQAINQESGDNFNALLNDYRIKEVCRRINEDETYTRMTIEAIAVSVGFKSRTSFGALFKAMTGLSPSAYQHLARENKT